MGDNIVDAIGIDLGTTNSVVAYMRGENPEVVPNALGERLTPSIVFLPEGGGTIVGFDAKGRVEQYPDRTFVSIKRRMGTSYRRSVDGKEYSPEEISAMILRSLKTDAERFLAKPLRKAVITVPANFNASERQATKSAGEIAGLEVMRVLNEPTAAALAYGHMNKLSRVVVVFDLGGGTFDISVVFGEDNVFEVLYSLGDNRLGGDDINMQILAHLVTELDAKLHVDVSQDKELLRVLRRKVVQAKHTLSDQEQAHIFEPNIGVSGGRRVDLSCTLDRATLKRVIEPSLRKIKQYAKRIVDELSSQKYVDRYGDVFGSRLEKCDVVLVGGETRVLAVREALSEEFAGRVFSNINPDEVVALGAAVQAGIIMRHENVQDIILIDSTSLSLGVEVKGGGFSVVVPANTPIPVTQTETYHTVADNQTEVLLKIYQGESSIASQNRLLGEFTLYGVPPRPAGRSLILTTFDLDANDILHVEARDKETGQRAQTTIKGSQTLSQEEVERMKLEAAHRESENSLILRSARLREQSYEALESVRHTVAPLRPILDSRYLQRLDGLMDTLELALQKGDIREMEKCFFDLHHSLPRPSREQPSIRLRVDAPSGFRIEEWGRLDVVLANQGLGAADDVQVVVKGQIREEYSGAVAVIAPGATQVIPISILPISAGDAVPITLAIEYKDQGRVPYMVSHSTTIQVSRQNQSVSTESKTLINIGEIISHAGTGDLYTRSKRDSIRGDQVGGAKTGDVATVRSGVNLGGGHTDHDRSLPLGAHASLCPACGQPVAPNAKFCDQCGERINDGPRR